MCRTDYAVYRNGPGFHKEILRKPGLKTDNNRKTTNETSKSNLPFKYILLWGRIDH